MFDFNGDGHTDSGEQYIGYKIYEDVTGSGSSGGSAPKGQRLDGLTVFIIVVIAYWLLNIICDCLY